MKQFDTLYARNSNNTINAWSISVEPLENMKALIHIAEGQLEGKETNTTRAVNKGKNIGKMNETTAYEQACKDAQSRWERKKKQGYKSLKDLNINIENYEEEKSGDVLTLNNAIESSLPLNRTDANNLSKPMKAQPYFKEDGSVRIKFPCFGQPKLNGFRVMARWEKVKENAGTLLETEVEKVVFRSKEGLRFTVLEHIEKEFTKEMFEIVNSNKEPLIDFAFDGEMYIHGELLSEISSAVKKHNNKTSLIKFYIFDIAVGGVSQKNRLDLLSFIDTQHFQHKCKNIIGVFRNTINSNEEAQTFTDECIKKGYEGAIFRDMKAEYQFGKRPQTMVKLKRFQDKEFKIVDVVGGDNSPELGVFICVQEQGLKFKVTPEGSQDVKKEYLSNKTKYIGKKLTVRFFERTKDNLPFHAVGTTIRDYE